MLLSESDAGSDEDEDNFAPPVHRPAVDNATRTLQQPLWRSDAATAFKSQADDSCERAAQSPRAESAQQPWLLAQIHRH